MFLELHTEEVVNGNGRKYIAYVETRFGITLYLEKALVQGDPQEAMNAAFAQAMKAISNAP